MLEKDDLKALRLAEWEARQSPIGFYNLALSYLEAADDLTSRIHDKKLQLTFDSPVRHFYAQTWELALKACLYAQGVRPHKLKRDFGHNLLRAWKAVDKERFARLNLTAETEQIANHLSLHHTEKMFAYPLTGTRSYLPLKHIMAESQRFRMERIDIMSLFRPEP